MQTIKPIRILTPSISRNAGGLFWAICSLSKALIAKGCELQVLAGEDAFSREDISAWDGVPVQIRSIIGPFFFGFQRGLLADLLDSDSHIVHVHGLWMYPSMAVLLWSRGRKPYLISPHGMLDPWAVNNSGWKKKLAGFVYENSHLRGASCIHALCQSEYESIRAYGLTNPVAIIPNGVNLPIITTECVLPAWDKNLPENAKVLFFLSRIHPKKGLENLLRAWAIAKSSNAPGNDVWHLIIAGWDQGGHQRELESLSEQLGTTATIHFVGAQFDQEKHASFLRADAFVLPSFSEGLPMAVLEAWAYHLPVLMTPHCNIPQGFTSEAAMCIDPEVNSITESLTTLFAMDQVQLDTMGGNGRCMVEQQFTWQKVAEQMLNVYQWVLGQAEKPDYVFLR